MVKRVFYIEKEKFLRSMMELALRAKKAEVYTVETLAENFYLIDDLKPELIIFDLDTAQASGPEALEKLYSYATHAKLIMTGAPSSENSMNKIVSGFIPKPIVAHNLAERVLSLID
ncbi:response regulator [Bacteriovorax sp. PP10]|uniref:Response regulator n=1 Tax=Bacteriovorax antarcticus TaxID=3088717 RepID=A0ABU5VR00_9BACT|nr:response regulator [Bacteriovorax sp. PP10]MEA9355481.1 response regulator [Bacteriovorax sp. PP10]